MAQLFQSVIDSEENVGVYFLCLVIALVCGVIATFAANYKSKISKSFMISLILLPGIVQTVIYLVNGNVGTGIAVAGAFSLIRFRSVAGKAKEIASVFLVMTAGLACAAGYIVIALLFTVLIGAAMMLLVRIPLTVDDELELRIAIPENLNYHDTFNDILDNYTKNYTMTSVKTANMGSIYKLKYRIELKDKSKIQKFMDELRCRNGNLEVALCPCEERSEEL